MGLSRKLVTPNTAVRHLTPVVPSVSATTVASRHRALPPASESSQYGSVSCMKIMLEHTTSTVQQLCRQSCSLLCSKSSHAKHLHKLSFQTTVPQAVKFIKMLSAEQHKREKRMQS